MSVDDLMTEHIKGIRQSASGLAGPLLYLRRTPVPFESIAVNAMSLYAHETSGFI